MAHGAGGSVIPRVPFINFLTPRPEEESFNEFGECNERVRDSLVGLLPTRIRDSLAGFSASTSPRAARHGDEGREAAKDRYLELPAGRDEDYDPYAKEGGDQKVQLSQPSFLLSSLPERQEDFITVDWGFYAERDRERRRKLDSHIQNMPWLKQLILHAWDGAQAWIALLLIGFLTGAIAAIIGIGCEWFTDLRFGVCRGRGFWITRDICCKDVHGSELCRNWVPWSDLLPLHPLQAYGLSSAWVDFGSYVAISTVYAVFAAWLCVAFSPYAAGSGISEIKVVLGGFVMKRLLGAWTLIAKSMGLMLSVGSGMMVGKEGPCVHLGCCTANLVSRFFSKFRDNEVACLSCPRQGGERGSSVFYFPYYIYFTGTEA